MERRQTPAPVFPRRQLYANRVSHRRTALTVDRRKGAYVVSIRQDHRPIAIGEGFRHAGEEADRELVLRRPSRGAGRSARAGLQIGGSFLASSEEHRRGIAHGRLRIVDRR